MPKGTRTSNNPQEAILDICIYDTQATEHMQLICLKAPARRTTRKR